MIRKGEMERMAMFGLLIGISKAFVEPSFPCPPAAPNGLVYRLSCYDFDGVEKTWTDARSSCRRRGGRLAMIPNVDVQNWLSSTAARKFPSRQGVWLGLNDRANEGTFYWDNYDGQDILATYFNWNEGEPDKISTQNCVYMRRSYEWRWVDVECNMAISRTYSSICEFNAPPSIVQHTSMRLPTALLSKVVARVTTAGTRTSVSLVDLHSQQLPLSSQRTSVPSSVTLNATPSQFESASTTASINFNDQRTPGYGSDFSAANAATAPTYRNQEAQFAHDSLNLKLLSAMGAFVLTLIALVVVLAIWRHRRRVKMNAAVALTTLAPKDTVAQPKQVQRPPEWQSLITSEVAEPFESSTRRKQVDESSASRRSSSGNIYVDIDALTSREQADVNSTILEPTNGENLALQYSRADTEIAALPPAPPPPGGIQVTEAPFTQTRALLATAAANEVKSADVAVTIVGAFALQTSSELSSVSAAADGQAAESYLEFVSSRHQVRPPTPIA